MNCLGLNSPRDIPLHVFAHTRFTSVIIHKAFGTYERKNIIRRVFDLFFPAPQMFYLCESLQPQKRTEMENKFTRCTA